MKNRRQYLAKLPGSSLLGTLIFELAVLVFFGGQILQYFQWHNGGAVPTAADARQQTREIAGAPEGDILVSDQLLINDNMFYLCAADGAVYLITFCRSGADEQTWRYAGYDEDEAADLAAGEAVWYTGSPRDT